MRTVTENYINYISSSLVRRPRSRFVVDNVIYSGDRYLVSYPKVEHKTDKAVGSFPAKTCELEILNIDGTLDLHGKEVTVYRGLDIGGSTEWVRIGVFMASDDNIKTNINKRTITFKGTDKTQKLDKPYGGRAQWDASRRVLHIVKEICDRNSIELLTSLFPMSDYVFPDIPPGLDFDNITDRQMIAYIAELSGSIAMFSHNGKLAIIGETDTGATIPKTKYKSLSVEKSVGPINAISFGHRDYEDSLLYMQDGVTDDTKVEWSINDNPLTTTTDRTNLIRTISGYFFGRSFTPFEVDGLIDDFIFDLNDTVIIEKKDGSTARVTLLEMSNSSRIKSRFGASLQTPGKTKTVLAGSVQERIGKVELIVDHQNNTIQGLVQDGENIKTVLEVALDEVSAHSQKIETIEKAGYITESQAQGLINASSESVALSVTKNLKIGTRNILLNSACFEGFSPVGYATTGDIQSGVSNDTSYPSGKCGAIVVSPADDISNYGYIGVRYKDSDILGESGSITKVKPGQVYTLSFWLHDAKLKEGQSRALSKNILVSVGSSASIEYADNEVLNVTNKKQKFTVTFTITGTPGKFDLVFARKFETDDTFAFFGISSLKLEEGNVATDWTPNASELENAVQSVEAKLELCVQTDENGVLKSVIHAKANQITIESDNFTLEATGNIIAKSGEIGGWIINSDSLSSEMSKTYPQMTMADVETIAQITTNLIECTSDHLSKYDLNGDGVINSTDSVMALQLASDYEKYKQDTGTVKINPNSFDETILLTCTTGAGVYSVTKIGAMLIKSPQACFESLVVNNIYFAPGKGAIPVSGKNYAWLAVDTESGDIKVIGG